MKKMIMFVAAIAVAAVTQAAAVGWSLAGANNYTGDAYQFFVIGQNGVTDIAQITALLDAGTDVSSYAFGSGNVGSTGMANTTAATSGKSIADAGTYTGFYVVYDTATFKAEESKYAVVSGAANLTKTIVANTSGVTFAAGNASSILNNADNWKATPEPTSAALLVLGVAALALRRKRA